MGEKKEYGEASSLLKSNIFLSPESWSIGDVLIKVKLHSPLYSWFETTLKSGTPSYLHSLTF